MTFDHSDNPWLGIPYQDYETHMASPEVGQLQFLNAAFKEILTIRRPKSLLVPGCAAGNGFEHIDPAVTKRVVAVDINPDYLMVLQERFPGFVGHMEVVNQDILMCGFKDKSFDLIFAGLIFEYIDASAALNQFRTWLKKDGALAVVLQLPDDQLPAVTETACAALQRLAPTMKLLTQEAFDSAAIAQDFERIDATVRCLSSGKRMYVASYVPRTTK